MPYDLVSITSKFWLNKRELTEIKAIQRTYYGNTEYFTCGEWYLCQYESAKPIDIVLAVGLDKFVQVGKNVFIHKNFFSGIKSIIEVESEVEITHKNMFLLPEHTFLNSITIKKIKLLTDDGVMFINTSNFDEFMKHYILYCNNTDTHSSLYC